MKFLLTVSVVLGAIVAVSSKSVAGIRGEPNVTSPIVFPGTFITLAQVPACWRNAQGRGVGRPVHTCSGGKEKHGALCYAPCKEGYTGVGFVCWENCPKGTTDIGVSCRKSAWSYHTKKTYTRHVGTPLTCSDNEEYHAGLCYDKCPAHMSSNGPVCWYKCSNNYPSQLGAWCCSSKDNCNSMFMALKKISDDFVSLIVNDILSGNFNILKFLKDLFKLFPDVNALLLPTCSKVIDN